MLNQLNKLGKQLGDAKAQLQGRVTKQRRHPEAVDEVDQDSQPSQEALQQDAATDEAILSSLPEDYYRQDFDAGLHEVQKLPPNFTQRMLEGVVEARSMVLEVISELLSKQVLQNYDKFVDGINQIASVEADLQDAHVRTKTARQDLAMALGDTATNIKIAAQTRRKSSLVSMLDTLVKLQQADRLHLALKEAQEAGEYAQAFWLCAQCAATMEQLQGLHVAAQLTATITQQYEDTTQRLETALQATCMHFQPEKFAKVLEGYMFLGNIQALEAEITSCFAGVVDTSLLQVMRGVVLTRAGTEERVRRTATLSEMLKLLPSDLYRTCLARSYMVLFDVLVSHHQMVRWHEAALEQHGTDLAQLQQAKEQLLERQRSGGTSTSSPAPVKASASPHAGNSTARRPAEGASAPASATSAGTQHAAVKGRPPDPEGGARASAGAETAGRGLEVRVEGRAQPGIGRRPSLDARLMMQGVLPTAGGRELAGLASHPNGHASEGHLSPETGVGGPANSELKALEAEEREEQEWGLVLSTVLSGLQGGKRFLWEETVRRIGQLLGTPSAFEGEHFLQVLEWTHNMLSAGEAFSGADSVSVRSLLSHQAGAFFAKYHANNLEGLHNMLDSELWRKLRPDTGGIPSLEETLRNPAHSETMAIGRTGPQAFAAWASAGNPWRPKVTSPVKRNRPAGHTLGTSNAGIVRSAGDTAPNGMGGGPDDGDGSAEDATAGEGDSDEELPEVFGDSIDEDTQTVRIKQCPSFCAWLSGSRPGIKRSCNCHHDNYTQRSGTSRSASNDQTIAWRTTPSGGFQYGSGPAAGDAEAFPTMTNSSWRMIRWMVAYADLMRLLRPAPFVFSGLADLFGMYLVHTFHTFSDVPLAEVLGEQPRPPHRAGVDAVSPRLRKTLTRILNQDLVKYRPLFIPPSRQNSTPGAAGGLVPGQPGAPGGMPDAAAARSGSLASGVGVLPDVGASRAPSLSQRLEAKLKEKQFTMMGLSRPSIVAPPGAGRSMPAPGHGGGSMMSHAASSPLESLHTATAICNSGNLWGLQERTVAVDSLTVIAQELSKVRNDLQMLLPPGDYSALDAFFSRTVDAAEDVYDSVLRTGARLNLPIGQITEHISGTSYDLAEPPARHAAWVDAVLTSLSLFREKLAHVSTLSPVIVQQLWKHAVGYTAEVMLHGIARTRHRCSSIGRNAMSSDVQEVKFALSGMAPPSPETTAAIEANLRLVENYIKAFFIQNAAELRTWVATHPEYNRALMVLLAGCIADCKGFKKKDKLALIALVEQECA